MRKIDLTNRRAGTLLVTGRVPDRARYWFATCTVCSRVSQHRQDTLTGANPTARCGCDDARVTHGATRKDGRAPDPFYGLWIAVKQRVRRQSYSYPLEIDPRWQRDFPTFKRDVLRECGPRPSKAHSLDRINVMRGYLPGNVRWETPRGQANNRTSSRLYPSPAYDAALTASEWAQYLTLLTGDTERWTRQRVQTLLEHLSTEELIAGVHPQRRTRRELAEARQRAEEKRVLEEMDRDQPDGLTLPARRIIAQADGDDDLFPED